MDLAHVKIKMGDSPLVEELLINGQNFSQCAESATIKLMAGQLPTIELKLHMDSLDIDGEYVVLGSVMTKKRIKTAIKK